VRIGVEEVEVRDYLERHYQHVTRLVFLGTSSATFIIILYLIIAMSL